MLLTIGLLLNWFLIFAYADKPDQSQNIVSYISAIISIEQTKTTELVPKDHIEGNCYLEGSSCNGADLILYDTDEKIIDKQSILSSNIPGFSFKNLNSQKKYKIRIQYPRYKSNSELTDVNTGELLHIQIKKTNSKNDKFKQSF
jgi:hypothetical protein